MLLHNAAETLYSEYKNLCSEKLLDEQDFPRMEQFAALKMQHRAENWEIANSNSLVRSYLKEYMQLMIKDDSLCVGAIMEAAAQMRRVTQGIGEMVNYLQYNRDILFSDSRDDIFVCFYNGSPAVAEKAGHFRDQKRLLNMVDVMTKLDVYDKNRWRRHMSFARITTLPRSPKAVSILCVRIVLHILWSMQDMAAI